MNLLSYLDSKGVEYAPFDPLRFVNFLQDKKIALPQNIRVVQIVGTNGKGSTGRFLAEILRGGKVKVGHFSSPHILSVTERFWLDGADTSYKELNDTFLQMYSELRDALSPLSYFELLTLLAIYFFRDRCDVLVLEAGVGGEFDSTTAISKELLLVTNIGFDHTDMLGGSLEQIVCTKLRASNCKTVVGCQSDSAVKEIIVANFADRDIEFLDENGSEVAMAKEYLLSSEVARYQVQNLALAIAAAKKILGFLPHSFKLAPPIGRFFKVRKNLIVDVGHNEQAAREVARELGEKKVVLLFNSFKDKDTKAILLALKKNIKRVEIVALNSHRVIQKGRLEAYLNELELEYSDYLGICQEEEYLAFGSFAVAQKIMELS